MNFGCFFFCFFRDVSPLFLIEVIFLVWFAHVSGSFFVSSTNNTYKPIFNFSFLWCYLQWLGVFFGDWGIHFLVDSPMLREDSPQNPTRKWLRGMYRGIE